MILKDFDLTPFADQLGDPDDHFAETYGDLIRVVRHADGMVIGVIDPDGKLVSPDRPPNPNAQPITATLDHKAGAARIEA